MLVVGAARDPLLVQQRIVQLCSMRSSIFQHVSAQDHDVSDKEGQRRVKQKLSVGWKEIEYRRQ